MPDNQDPDSSEGSRSPETERPNRLAVFDQYRGLLFSIAYRMIGSVADAEDMLQETFIRWQQTPDDEEIRSPRAYLVTVISRLCINHLQSARVQREEYVGQWLPEPLLTNPGNLPSDALCAYESLSTAFLLLLERLTPIERAVFLLREIFNYEYAEIAAAVRQSEVNCRQILRRARQHVADVRPRVKTSAEEQTVLLEGFLQATRSGDLAGLVALLSADVVLHSDGGGKGPAAPNRIHGADKVARAIFGGLKKQLPPNLVRRMAQINGSAGAVTYLNGKPFAVLTLDVSEGSIQAIYIVSNPEKLSHFPELPPAPC